MDDVKSRVLDAARTLFLKQGYKKTTIRQIVEHSGVLIGSIYHFFENKEDVFRALALSVYDLSERYARERLAREAGPVYRCAVSGALMLSAVEEDERVAELSFEAYNSTYILGGLVEHMARRAQEVFSPYNPGASHRDFCRRALAVSGVMRSMIAVRLMPPAAGLSLSLEEKIDTFLEAGLYAYGVPPEEIEVVKSRLRTDGALLREATRDLIAAYAAPV